MASPSPAQAPQFTDPSPTIASELIPALDQSIAKVKDNFLRPKLVAGRVRLSGVAMFVARLGGLQAFGALGIILGPVLFATAAAILDVLRETQPSPALRAEASERKVV